MKEQKRQLIQEHTHWPKELWEMEKQEGPRERFQNFIPVNTPLYRLPQVHLTAHIMQPAYTQALEELRSAVAELKSKVASLLDRFEEYIPSKIVPLHGLSSKQYTLRRPLLVLVETYEGETVARLPEFDIYASAENEADALASLQREIIELYEDLRKTQADLGALPASWLRELSSYIEERA